MREYCFFPDNGKEKFIEACEKIETAFPKAVKKELLIDVDGSLIQIFVTDEKEIVVIDDYDYGEILIRSEIDLSGIIN